MFDKDEYELDHKVVYGSAQKFILVRRWLSQR